jgi:hypothetical protein
MLTRAQAASIIRDAFLVGRGGDSTLEDIQDHWAKDAIDAVISAGVMSGCTDEHFCPDEPLTRAQAASVIARVTNIRGNARAVFNDVPADHWAAQAISGLYDRGHIGGCSSDKFCLDAPMRRWIFITWIVNVKKITKVSCQ